MVTGMETSQWPDWAQAALESARLAPSAVNQQPWSFDLHKDSITVSIRSASMDLNVSRRLDCGIAMLHIELGAQSRGIYGTWEFLNQPDVARFTVN